MRSNSTLAARSFAALSIAALLVILCGCSGERALSDWEPLPAIGGRPATASTSAGIMSGNSTVHPASYNSSNACGPVTGQACFTTKVVQ